MSALLAKQHCFRSLTPYCYNGGTDFDSSSSSRAFPFVFTFPVLVKVLMVGNDNETGLSLCFSSWSAFGGGYLLISRKISFTRGFRCKYCSVLFWAKSGRNFDPSVSRQWVEAGCQSRRRYNLDPSIALDRLKSYLECRRWSACRLKRDLLNEAIVSARRCFNRSNREVERRTIDMLP